MSKVKRNPMVEMVVKVPVKGSKGSLQAAIDKLLKTIDLIESTIMVPTLLRDKCEFDAKELLKVANIIRASIKGEYDTMESLINDINSTNNDANDTNTAMLQSNGISSPTSSLSQQQSIFSTVSSPTLIRHQQQSNQQQQQTLTTNHHETNPNSLSLGPLSLGSDCSPGNGINLKLDAIDESPPQTDQPITIPPIVPMIANRTAQPPSLLQLTTNNNHINQMRSPNLQINGHENNNNLPATISPNNHEVGNQINSLQKSLVLANNSGYLSGNSTPVGASLTNNNNGYLNNVLPGPNNSIVANSGIGASLLKRTYSNGAMSPHGAPQTPIFSYPPIEGLHVLPGDPSASAKLLGEIEQLKVSLSTVTNLLESVVELYKKYVDNLYS